MGWCRPRSASATALAISAVLSPARSWSVIRLPRPPMCVAALRWREPTCATFVPESPAQHETTTGTWRQPLRLRVEWASGLGPWRVFGCGMTTSAGAAGSAPATRGPWWFLAWLVLQQRRRVALGAFLGTAWMIGLVLPPYLLSQAVDGLADADGSAVLAWSAALVVTGAALAWLGIWRHRTMTQVRMDAAFRTVSAVTSQAIRLGVTLDRQSRAGEIVTIGIRDAWTIRLNLTVTGPGVGAVLAYVVIAVLLFQFTGQTSSSTSWARPSPTGSAGTSIRRAGSASRRPRSRDRREGARHAARRPAAPAGAAGYRRRPDESGCAPVQESRMASTGQAVAERPGDGQDPQPLAPATNAACSEVSTASGQYAVRTQSTAVAAGTPLEVARSASAVPVRPCAPRQPISTCSPARALSCSESSAASTTSVRLGTPKSGQSRCACGQGGSQIGSR